MAEESARWGGFGLWYGVVAGIVFWAFHLTGMAAITPYICHSGNTVWFHVLTWATLVPTLLAFWPAWIHHRRDVGEGGAKFMGSVGLLVTAISSLAIIAEYVPVFMLHPCAS